MRLRAIDPARAEEDARELLAGIQDELGMVPNLLRTMANAPAVLTAYLGLGQALARGVLPETLRQQIYLAVSEANRSEYCLAAQAAMGRTAGLTEEDLADSRRASCPDSRIRAALQFARAIVASRGRVSDDDLRCVRRAGHRDREIVEIIANVMCATFSNYFNHVAETEVDFPPVSPLDRTTTH